MSDIGATFTYLSLKTWDDYVCNVLYNLGDETICTEIDIEEDGDEDLGVTVSKVIDLTQLVHHQATYRVYTMTLFNKKADIWGRHE